MNKYSAITAIVIVSVYLFRIKYLGAEQLEFRWNQPGNFSFFTMSNHGEIEFCNTFPIWISFQKFEIATFYDSEHIGSFIAKPLTIDPNAIEV